MTEAVLAAGFANFEDLVMRLHKGNEAAEKLSISNDGFQRIIAETISGFLEKFPEDAEAPIREALVNTALKRDPSYVSYFDVDPHDLPALKRALEHAPELYVAEARGITAQAALDADIPAGEWLEPCFNGYLSLLMDLVEWGTKTHGEDAWEVLKDVPWEIGLERGRKLVERFNIRGDDFPSLMKVYALGGSILCAGERPTTAMEIIERTDKKLVGHVHNCALAEQFSRIEKDAPDPQGGMCMRCWDHLDQAAFELAGAKWKNYQVPKRLAAGDEHCVFIFESE
jgi:hypothetical protein